ncbi:predicted protein [Phaeodactylum tricornutum CCAP 1055/1]|uniref:Uncharacterized protein n=3 Tax=Phaeodactylum tricornutum TaxID=2850 RepID=B7GBZ9_PHATC|nr:predicted protein [Phaeodactylum tricornutum CCAP 1055/1]EEC43775.1 predicted protein [Phaeodactylum tricornutum CCAP 1055/1]|eukprot:XP_002184716.1 predicted protein [Phaeodactylum tricornutum CCAP 1055/1]
MSVRQVKDTNRNVGGDHVEDGDGTVEFVSALLSFVITPNLRLPDFVETAFFLSFPLPYFLTLTGTEDPLVLLQGFSSGEVEIPIGLKTSALIPVETDLLPGLKQCRGGGGGLIKPSSVPEDTTYGGRIYSEGPEPISSIFLEEQSIGPATQPTMVPATRQMTSEAVYAHILDNILLLSQEHPIRLSFQQQGYETAIDILSIFENELDALGYKSPTPIDGVDNPRIPLLMAHRQILRHFLRWQASLERQKGSPMKPSELIALNNEDFVQYRGSALGQVSTTNSPSTLAPTSTSITPKVRSAADDFRRGVKCDKTHYPVLKDDKYWDNFYRLFVVTAVSHNVEKVLDPMYALTEPSDKALFEEQKKFVYSALEHTLQTDMASAKISSATTLGYLTTAKYGSSWTGTAEGFILHWKNHLCIYHNTVPMAEQLPKQLCLSLLENAVHNVPELCQVKITATLDLAKGDFDTDPDVNYNIDLSPSVLYEANAHARRENCTNNRHHSTPTNRERPYIPRDMWNQLSDDAKAILQGLAAPAKVLPVSNGLARPLMAHVHATGSRDAAPDDNNGTPVDTFHDCAPETELLAHLSDRVGRMDPGDIRKVLAASRNTVSTGSLRPHGTTKSLQSNVLQYQVSRHTVQNTTSALVDRGANGGLAGSDVTVLHKTGRSANITGINEHTLSNLDIVTAAGLVESQRGPIVVIMHQYAHLGKGKTIHSSAQLEHCHNCVQDRSRTVGGNQRIVTLDDYIIPLNIRQGLPYMDMRAPTSHELHSLPHVVLTSDVDWDPSVLDNEIDMKAEWHTDIHDLPGMPYIEPRFDNLGQYMHRHVAICNSQRHDALDRILTCNKHAVQRNEHDYDALRPCLAWVSSDTVRKTIFATTQYAREVYNAPLRRRSLVTDVYPMKTDKEFVNALEDHIRYRGAMDKLISDRAQAEISKKVTDITRAYHIDQWQSEPHHQHQNFAE